MQQLKPIIQKIRTSLEPRKTVVPLIVEPHPKDYTGYPFLTLVQYRKNPMLVIVDNADDEVLRTFVLDLCGPEGIDQEMLFQTALYWYEHNRANFPISVEFSKMGLTHQTSRIYRALNIEFVSRLIGPVPKYPMHTIKSIKRRRRKPIPLGVEIVELTVEDMFEQF